MGEAAWWKGPYWMKDYSTNLGPSPQFWEPSGITRLTIRQDEVVIDYIHTAGSRYSNHPAEAGIGTVLSTRRLVNPPARLLLERHELTFQAVEGRKGPEPEALRIKNSGSGRLRYELKTDAPWLRVFRSGGESWGEWDEVKVYVRSSSLAEGEYRGTITVTSSDLSAPPEEVSVRLTVQPLAFQSSTGIGEGQKRTVRTPHPAS